MSYEEFFPLPLVGRFYENGRRLMLTEPLLYVDKDGTIEVPVGFTSDFNSVPLGFWNIFPPWQYPEAGIIHDYLYENPGLHTRGDCDRTHKRVLEILGCPFWKRHTAYSLLRLAGGPAWKRHRAKDVVVTKIEIKVETKVESKDDATMVG